MISLLLDLFFPKRCVGCKRFGTYWCKNCVEDIPQADLICPMCQKLAVGGQTHPVCTRRYGLDGLWSLGAYKDSLKVSIVQFKYKYVRELSKVLIDILVEYWAKHSPFLLDGIKSSRGQGWLVVPVPLHNYRKNWRGFNQAEVLAQDLASRLGLKYAPVLKRIHYTAPQAKLKKEQRRINLKNTLQVDENFLPALPAGRLSAYPFALIIDDVWTTGSTLKQCCYELKKAGVKQVWAITLAR